MALFDKSPAPQKDDDIYCPHFWELKYANGCAFDCQWCYLNGTYRFKETGKAPTLKDLNKIVKDVESAIKTLKTTVFNAGEVSDALVYEGTLINKIIPLFHKHRENGNKLLLLTKSNSTKTIGSCTYAKNEVIFAYSVNAIEVAHRWEKRAPTVPERLYAAREAINYGYEVRLRIDPIVPVTHYQDGYRELVKNIMHYAPTASVITLGSLRGLLANIITGKKLGKDMTWTDFLREKSNWGDRIPHELRAEAFAFVIDELRKAGYTGEISLCKETMAVYKQLKINPFKQICNCMFNSPLTPIGLEKADKDWKILCSKDATVAEKESGGAH